MVNIKFSLTLEDGRGVGISSESLLTINKHCTVIKCEEY